MKSYLLEEQVDVEKREEPRRRCSVYVTFGTGLQVETALIIDYSDSGLRLKTSGRSYLGNSIEIIDSESPLFHAKRGRVMWQRKSTAGTREFGVRLVDSIESSETESRLDQMWRAIQQIAFEEAYS